MKKNILLFGLIVLIIKIQAQNVVVSDDSTYVPQSTNALLEINSSQGNKGVLVPKLTTTQRTAMSLNATHDKGLLVYDTDSAAFFYYNGSSWLKIAGGSALLKDADGDTKIQVEESTDEDNIRFDVAGNEAVVIDEDGKMGIGANNPSALLHLKAKNTSWDKHIKLENYSDTEYANILFDDDGLKFKNYGTSKDFQFRNSSNFTLLFIDENKKIGINTTSPSNALSVNGDADFIGGVEIDDNLVIGNIGSYQPLNVCGDIVIGGGSNDYDDAAEFMRIEAKTDDWYIGVLNDQYHPDFFIGTDMNSSNRHFQFTSDGRLGINVDYPYSLLDVNSKNPAQWDAKLTISALGSNIAYLGQMSGSGSNAYQGKLMLSDSSNYTVVLQANGDSYINGGDFAIGTDNPENKFTVIGNSNFNGNVGIGTNNPSFPLEVATSGGSYTGTYGYLNSNGNTNTTTDTNPYSIKASGRILASEFNAVSDQRIKTHIHSTNTLSDLEKLMQLRLTTYHFIDSVATGTKLQKGFIAQEVEQVIPEAVNQSTGFIPDIFALATSLSQQDSAILVMLPKAHKLEPGDKVRMISPEGQTELEVMTTPDAQSFTVKLNSKPVSLFVYGKQVDDFRAVDYDYIFSTGIGAIQELAKQNQELQSKNNDLEERTASVEQRLERLEQLMTQQSNMNSEQTNTQNHE